MSQSQVPRQSQPEAIEPDQVVGNGNRPADPWERGSMLLGSIWLVFLIFPATAAWSSDHPLWARLLTIGALLAFIGTYIRGYGVGHWGHVKITPIVYLAVLGVLAASTFPVAGLGGPLACLIFMMAFCMFAFPLRLALLLAIGAYVTLVVLVLTSGDIGEWGFMMGLALAVGIGVGAVRITAQSGERYQEAERELAVTRERERVARDVHDLLGHSLTAITIKAELAEKLLDVDVERARREIVEVQELSREAITEVRHTVGSLRARRLDAEIEGAAAALRAAGIEVFLSDDDPQVDPRLRLLFAWVIREAATNVLRHANASSCWIEVEGARVSISDDGVGLGASEEGHGLRGLRERVEEAGGTLVIGERDGGGTTVEVTA